MELERQGNILNIKGNIKSIEDYETIKSEIEAIRKNYQNATINILDSFSITSSIIGYLYKITNEGFKINLYVKNEILYNLLNDLNLINLFNVKKI